jgi:hypothetical protein
VSSLTSRLGFNVPAATDLADPSVYYNPNITILENELPSKLLSVLGTASYDGKIQTVNESDGGTTAGNYAGRMTYGSIGGIWTPIGNFNQQAVVDTFLGWLNPTWNETTPNASGSELFEANPLDLVTGSGSTHVTSLTLPNDSIYKIELQTIIQPSGANFQGNLNVFMDTTTSTQPTPATGTATKRSFPITTANGTTNQSKRSFYHSFWYTPTSTNTVATVGFSIYLSAIQGQAKAVQNTIPGVSSWIPAFGSLVKMVRYYK